jgi:hypothetical protein
MKKYFFILLSLLFTEIIAVQAQADRKLITASEYLKKAPQIPDSICSCPQPQKEAFSSAVSDLMETIKSDAEDRQHQTGEYMQSKEEQMKTNMMKQAGLTDEEMEKMKSGKEMTDEEKAAMINRMMQQKMNMSLDEAKNLKNMSKEGQKAWAQGYVAEQMAVAQANPQQKNAESDKAKATISLQAEIMALNNKLAGMQQELSQEWASLEQEAAAGQVLLNNELKPLNEELNSINDGEGSTKADLDHATRVSRKIQALQDKYCMQYTPKLVEFLRKCKPVIEKSFPDYDRLEELQIKSTSATTGVNLQPKSMGIASITAVNFYLGFLEKDFKYRLH